MGIWLFRRKEEKEKPKEKVKYELTGWRKALFYFVLVIAGLIILNFIFLGFARAGALSYLWFKFVDGLIWLLFVSGFAWLVIGFIIGFVVPKPVFEYKLENGKTGWRLVLRDPEAGSNYEFRPLFNWRKPIVVNKDYVDVSRHALIFTKYITTRPMTAEEKDDKIILTASDLLTEKAELDKLRITQLETENLRLRKKVQELISQIQLTREQEVKVVSK